MSDTKGSGMGFLLLVLAVGLIGWRLVSPTDADTQVIDSPNACARYLLDQAGYGPSTYPAATPIPNELRDEITTECILPYLTPANR